MSAIGSRFNSLKFNALDPLDGVKKKNKKTKKEKKIKPQLQENVQSIIEVATAVVVLNEDITPKPFFNKSQNVIVRDVMEIRSREKVSITCSTILPVVRGKPDQDNRILNENEVERGDDDVEKDDRGLRARSTYKKMVVSEGRVYERRGGPTTSVKPQEKRQGCGAHNWGNEAQVETEYNENADKTINEETEAIPQKEPEVVQYTYGQYKKLLEDNKVDPLAWKAQAAMNTQETTDPEQSDIREYDYSRQESSGYRGRGTGRYHRGRGEFRGQGDHGYRRGGSGNYRGRDRRESGSRLQELRVDDIKDFPAL